MGYIDTLGIILTIFGL